MLEEKEKQVILVIIYVAVTLYIHLDLVQHNSYPIISLSMVHTYITETTLSNINLFAYNLIY